MTRIFKYPLNDREAVQIIEMPRNAQIISVGTDPIGNVCIWAAIEEKQPNKEKRIIYRIGTGWPIELIIGENAKKFDFIGSVKDGEYMWHIFDGGLEEYGDLI